MLSPAFRVILQAPNAPRPYAGDALLALHARRSHDAIVAWRQAHPSTPLLVALTGTDLYRDLPAGDEPARASLAAADRIIVLQDDASRYVPAALRDRCRVVVQSARALVPWPRKRDDRLHCVLVAHLRAEKDPQTAFAAWRLLPPALPATLTIVGAALDPALGRAARDLAADDPRVQWLGPRPHAWTRQAIKRAHALLVPSRMEGGANVVAEAVMCGTPVLGSRMSGNVGMLGGNYGGLFPVGDAHALADLVMRACADRRFLHRLEHECAGIAPRFAPAVEARALHDVVAEAFAACRARMPA